MIWQIARTVNASVATAEAIDRTETRLAQNQMLLLLPQFLVIENDLDFAAENGDRGLARRSLVNCRNVASELAAILEDYESADAEAIANLRSASRTASVAKSALISEPNREVSSITANIREQLGNVMADVTALRNVARMSGA